MRKFVISAFALLCLFGLTGATWLPLLVPAPTGKLLNTLSATASHAYSTRKLLTAYAGSAVQVLRTTDSTTQNIGFDGSGNLDSAALNTFCTGATCGVSIWYDQIGTANCSAGAAINQPRLYLTATVDTLNSHPAPLFGVTNANSPCTVTQSLLAQPNTIAFATKHNSQVVNGHWTDGATSSPRNIIGVSGSPATTYQLYAGTTGLTGGTLDTSTHAVIGIFNGASSSLTVDGVVVIPTGTTPGSQGLNNFVIGAANGGGGAIGMKGYIGEFITFNSSISGADQALIRTSWQSYWGTP